MATIVEPEITKPAGAGPRPSVPQPGARTGAAPGGRRRIVFAALGLALVALLGLGVKKWWFARSHVSTDNAQVDGHIIPILPKVGGFVSEVRAQENQNVKAGDNLRVLDDRDFRARLPHNEADLAPLLATRSSRTRGGQAEGAGGQAPEKGHQAPRA